MLKKITNIGTICTWSVEDNKVVYYQNKEILVDNGLIIEIMDQSDSKNNSFKGELIDAKGAFITPGFIDSHTHPIFYSNRSKEFHQRSIGLSYQEIAKKGGGILSSINNLRKCSEEDLYNYCLKHINYFLGYGTTTVEAKSGYGLNLDDELKSLRVIKRLNKESKLDLIPTFMGAHAFPPEYSNSHGKYIDLVCDEMIPKISEEKLAVFCDVFCEKNYFTYTQSKKILNTAKEYGLHPRLHADEFEDSGAAELAAEVKAVSADHLMAASISGLSAMAKSKVLATILPGTTFYLGKTDFVSYKKIADAKCEVVIATDFNPGSCTIQSMPFIILLATLYCGMDIEIAFKASTYNAAKSILKDKEIGLIKKNYNADLVFWDIDSLDEIAYWGSSDRIINVIKSGNLV